MAKKQMPKWQERLLKLDWPGYGIVEASRASLWNIRRVLSGQSKHRRGRVPAHRGGKAAQARRARRKKAAADRKRTFNQPYGGKG